MTRGTAVVFAMLACAGISFAHAQESSPSILSGIFTEQQALRGKALFGRNCAVCHGSNLISREGLAPSLTESDFEVSWHQQTLGSRFEVIRRTMPVDAEGTLEDQEYLDIVTYVLKFNGYPSGSQELKPDVAALNKIMIVPAKKP